MVISLGGVQECCSGDFCVRSMRHKAMWRFRVLQLRFLWEDVWVSIARSGCRSAVASMFV